MTYQQYITNIIMSRGQHNCSGYFEMHHIIPRCKGGLGDNSQNKFKKKSTHPNCIWLYPREHYMAHKLLADENSEDFALTSALWRMINGKNGEYADNPICTPEEYEDVRLKWVNVMRDRMTGENSPMYGKHFDNINCRKAVIDIVSMNVYDSLTQAAIKTNVDLQRISKSCIENSRREWAFLTNNNKFLFCFYDNSQDYINQRKYVKFLHNKENWAKAGMSETMKSISFIWLNTGEVFNSFHDIETKYGFRATKVCACCKGKCHAIFIDNEPQVFMYLSDANKFNSTNDALSYALKKVRKKRKVINLFTNQIYNSIKEASVATGQSESRVGKQCRGEIKGGEWQFLY